MPVSFLGGRPPTYVADITGLSSPEEWATWTDGDRLAIRFARPLPASFDVILQVAGAYAANAELPITVRAGPQAMQFVAGTGPREVRLGFAGVEGVDVLVFEIPRASSPADAGVSRDTRRLGIALTSMRIVPR